MMLEGVMEEDATLAGETAQGAPVGETMMGELIDETMMADLAWSAEEPVIDLGHERRWPLWAALVLVLCFVTGAAVWLGTVFYQEQWHRPSSATVETPPVPTPPVNVVAAPKPLPAPGPPAQHENPPADPPPDVDKQFVAEVSLIPGISVTDVNQLITSTKVMCTELENGHSAESEIEATMRNTGISRGQAEQFFDAGTTIYCPKFARR